MEQTARPEERSCSGLTSSTHHTRGIVMSINLTNISQLEAKIDKAMKQMKSLTTTTKADFVIESVDYYLNELKKKKIIS